MGTATGALSQPGKVICERGGRMWIADSGQARVLGAERDGRVHTLLELLGVPQGMAIDAACRRLYVADPRAGEVRAIELGARRRTSWAIEGAPFDVAVDEYAGWLYVALATAHRIARVRLDDGELQPLAGRGDAAHVDGPLGLAAFSAPHGLVLSPDRSRLYVADTGSSAVRVIDLREQTVRTLAATGMSGGRGIALSPAGVVVADTGSAAVRGVNARHGTVVSIWSSDREPVLRAPSGVAFDLTDRSYVVADTGNDRLIRITRDGTSAAPIALTM